MEQAGASCMSSWRERQAQCLEQGTHRFAAGRVHGLPEGAGVGLLGVEGEHLALSKSVVPKFAQIDEKRFGAART
jgi:hypothetical protein